MSAPHAANAYELRHTGPERYLMTSAGEAVWADGFDDRTGEILEAKYAGDRDRSPFLPGSSLPDHLRRRILAQVRDEVRRFGLIIADPDNPTVSLTIITDDPAAVVAFSSMLADYAVPGRVVVRD